MGPVRNFSTQCQTGCAAFPRGCTRGKAGNWLKLLVRWWARKARPGARKLLVRRVVRNRSIRVTFASGVMCARGDHPPIISAQSGQGWLANVTGLVAPDGRPLRAPKAKDYPFRDTQGSLLNHPAQRFFMSGKTGPRRIPDFFGYFKKLQVIANWSAVQWEGARCLCNQPGGRMMEGLP